MGSHGSNASGASPLEATRGGNSNMGPPLEPCAAEEQGKADSWKTSNVPDPLSFAHTTVVTIHNLACFLLVAFLTKLVRLVISV